MNRKTLLLLHAVFSTVLMIGMVKCGFAETIVSGSISGTWSKANSPYVIQGSVYVTAGQTLTIEAGVEVRSLAFNDRIDVYGTLIAQGSSTDSIRFNGFKNDNNSYSSHGGSVQFMPGSVNSFMEYVSFNQWGDTYYYAGSVYLLSASTTITHCNFRNSESAGIFIEGEILPIINNNNFQGEITGISGSPVNLTKAGNNINASIKIRNVTATGDVSIPRQSANSYYMLDGGFSVSQGGKLTIEPGVEIRCLKFNDQITVYGTLIAKGTLTDSIRFTGFANDQYTYSSHGGTIRFTNTSSNSILDYVSIDRWGDSYYSAASLYLSTSDIIVSHSHIRNSETAGIFIDEQVTPSITNNDFTGENFAISANPGNFTNLTGNTHAVLKIRNGAVTANAILPKQSTGSYYQLEGGFSISQGGTLTIQPGVEIRSIAFNDQITVYGTLIARGNLTDSIRLIGFANEQYTYSSHGGSIRFINTATNCVLDYVSIDRWGDSYYTAAAISLSSSDVNISHSHIQNSETAGIFIDDQLTPAITGNNFMGEAIAVSGNANNYVHIAGNTNAVLKIRNSTVTANATLPKQAGGSYYQLEGGFVVNQHVTLTIQPGTEIRSIRNNDIIWIYGTLTAKGTAGELIRFTGFANDQYSYSSHGGGINFSEQSDGSLLEYVSIDRWGDTYYSQAAINNQSSTLTLNHCSISNSEAVAIYNNSDTLTVLESDIYNNSTGLYNTKGKDFLQNCKIYNNTDYGINNTSTDTVDARNTYWGSATGPLHTTLNPGGSGNPVSDKVMFIPWVQQQVQVEQTITLPLIAAQYIGDTLLLKATASSGLPVTYSLITLPAAGVVRLSEDTLFFTGNTGQVTLTAKQAGNTAYKPTEIQQNFGVQQHTQTITFSAIASRKLSEGNFTFSASASSGLPVSFRILSGPAVINNDSLKLTGAGNITIEALQTGNARYMAATPVRQTFNVWPNSPDLSVTQVTSPVVQVAPGDSVTVNWEIANEGNASALKTWIEQLFIQSADGSNRTYIRGESFSAADSLKPGQSLARTTRVRLPDYLTVGDKAVFVVTVLPTGNVQETPGSQQNNTRVQDAPWSISKTLSVTISSSQLNEGSAYSTGATLYRSGATDQPLQVSISSAKPGKLSYPASLTIPAGQTGISFSINAIDNELIEGEIPDTIGISAPGYTTVNLAITITDNDKSFLTISNLPANATEGDTVRFSIHTNLISTVPLEVYLTTYSQVRFPLPSTIIIPAGKDSVSLAIPLVQDSLPETSISITIAAGAANHIPANDTIRIDDDDIPGMELLLHSSILSETGGIYATKATLRRRPGSNGSSFTAYLTANLSDLLVLPSAIAMAAGEQEKTFTIGVTNNNTVDGDRVVTITAAMYVTSCGCTVPPASTDAVSANLTIKDDDGPALQLTISKQTLAEGIASAAQLRIARNTSTANTLTVNLLSSLLTEATVPTTVIIPAGQAAIDVPVTTINDGAEDGSKEVYFSASAPGFSTGTTWVIVTDANKPDLQIDTVKITSGVQAGALMTYNVTIKNTGFATIAKGVRLKAYLSKDSFIDATDIFFAEDTTRETIPSGQHITVLNAVKTPDMPGQYQLLFVINPDSVHTELLYTNNVSIGKAITITPRYTAIAHVDESYFLKGVSIPIKGSAIYGAGGAATNVPIEVYVMTNGIRRTVAAKTDGSGNFTTVFVPLAIEAGYYSVGASFPGIKAVEEQDSFDILGVRINNGKVLQFNVTMNDTLKGNVSVQNLSKRALTNLTLQTIKLPTGAFIQFDTLSSLAANATVNLGYRVTGSIITPGEAYAIASLSITAQEGNIQTADVQYYCQTPNALLATDRSSIKVTVPSGKTERLVEIKIRNKGKGNSGGIKVILPKADWVQSVTVLPIPAINAGDTTVLLLRFLATAEIPYNFPVTSSIIIQAENGASLNIPFTYEQVTTSTGAARIVISDQFTYYSEGAPGVKDAQVQITDYYSGTVLATGTSDNNGQLLAVNLPEGKHRVKIEKEKHTPYDGYIVVNAGDTTEAKIFISYQAITFNWSVVPTAIQDKYDITLETKFETNVPMPVVMIDMPKSIPKLTGTETYSFNVTLTNHGLIAAEKVALALPNNDPEYEFIMNYEPMSIGAHQSIQVPVLVRLRTTPLPGGRRAGTPVSEMAGYLGISARQADVSDGYHLCWGVATVNYWYKCNLETGLWEANGFSFKYPRLCAPEGGGGGQTTGGGGGGGGIGWSDGDWALLDWWMQWMSGWGNNLPDWCPTCGPIQPLIPKPPLAVSNPKKHCKACTEALDKQLIDFLKDQVRDAAEAVTAVVGGVPAFLGKYAYSVGCAGTVIVLSTLDGGDNLGEIIWCIPDKRIRGIKDLDDMGGALSECLKSLGALRIASNQREMNDESSVYTTLRDNLLISTNALNALNSWSDEYYGTVISESEAWPMLKPLIEPYVGNLKKIDSTKAASIINEMAGYEIDSSTLKTFIARWNQSLTALNQGVMQPTAQYPDIINWALVKSYSNAFVTAKNQVTAKGYGTIAGFLDSTLISIVELVEQDKQEVCASVTVQFNQQLTMTREAFEGTLEIFNGHPNAGMDSLSVQIQITDSKGNPANGFFEMQTKNLTNLTNVTGAGSIASQEKGSVKFLFIPQVNAAPVTAQEYYFGGYIRYRDPYVKAMVTLPLSSIPITVNPSPNLMLHYFMQRNILGDDPLTSPAVEPSIPADLAVMVENQGYGPAVNMTISSAQPKIIDNEKGLAINFQLTGSNFQGQAKKLGVTDINFGTIQGQQTRIGQWYFTSSLFGKFTSYEAKVVHANSLGNPNLSLVKGIRLHELTKSIKAYGTMNDGINDFLVNDVFDVNDIPDQIYFSQGQQTAKVNQATAGNFSGPVLSPDFTNILSVTPADTGYNYIKLPDPGNRQYELASITRNDGQEIPLDNAWLTFVTLPIGGSPVYENKFHLIDRFTTNAQASYTVVWKPKTTNLPEVDSIYLPASPTAMKVNKVKVTFNKQIDGATFTKDDLALTFMGGANLINSSVTITQSDTATFEIDLSALTTGNGYYLLTVQAAAISDIYGNTGEHGKQAGWSQFLTIPMVQQFGGIPDSHQAASFDKIEVLFNIPIDATTVTPERFTVKKNGVTKSGNVTIDSVRADQKLYYLSGLGAIITESGEYELIVDVPGIRSLSNDAGAIAQSIVLTLDNAGPQVIHISTSDSGAVKPGHFPFVKIDFDEEVTNFNTASIELTRNGIIFPLNVAQLSNTDLLHWIVGNLGMATYADGDYKLTVNLSGISDKAGNAGTGNTNIMWTVNSNPQVTISDISINPDEGYLNTDGITAAMALTVNFNISGAATELTISQTDPSGEKVLITREHLAAGTHSLPVTLLSGGNAAIKITATGVNGIPSSATKLLYIDRIPLTANWLPGNNVSNTRQQDTVALRLSARLLNDTGFTKAVRLTRDGANLPTAGLNLKAVNDSLYEVNGLRQAGIVSGKYELSLELSAFRKYNSGKTGENTIRLQWEVQSINNAPIAKAGNDELITAPGVVLLRGDASSDSDGDQLTYSWISPDGVTLVNPNSSTPSFTVTTADEGKIYSFLLIVSDGTNFTTDVVQVIMSATLSGPLPVRFIAFGVTAEKDRILLSWNIQDEPNNSGFDIERSESFASGFVKIGRVAAAGSTSRYQWFDLTAEKVVRYYYRLKQTDKDGKFRYSETKTAMLKDPDSKMIRLMPNPVETVLQVVFGTSFGPGNLRMKIVDPKGAVIMQRDWNLGTARKLEWNLSQLSNGQYFLLAEDRNGTLYVEGFLKR